MPHPLPLNLCLFTSAAGHFGRIDTYQVTLNYLERQCGGDLSTVFAHRVAHIKVRPSRPVEEERLPAMLAYFKDHGVDTIVTRGEWERGMSMGHAYLSDQRTMFWDPAIQAQPYTFFTEDDAPIWTYGSDLTEMLSADCRRLASDPRTLCCRYAWKDSPDMVPYPADPAMLSSPWYHYQPHVARSRDLLIASNLILGSWHTFQNLHCEMASTIAMRALAGESEYRFLVHRPDQAYAFHLGGQDYDQVRAAHGL